MARRIQRFSVGQTAKVIGVLYALMGLIFIPFFLLIATLSPEAAVFGTGFAIALPVMYGIGGFVFAALGCALYNLVAGWVGGIEVELSEG
jgi:hypothetical protein